jgi:4'-phosphopantetheinyl transferase
MLRSALQEVGFAGDLARILYSPEERPYFEDGPDFNISHSGTLVACIIGPSDRSRVGIDLEEKKSIDIDDFRGQFTAREWEMIRQDGDPLQMFYHLWTAKEALIKADGRGLQIPLSEVVVGEGGGGVAKIGKNNWFLSLYEISAGYTCHVAGEREMGTFGVGVLEPEVFLRNIPT